MIVENLLLICGLSLLGVLIAMLLSTFDVIVSVLVTFVALILIMEMFGIMVISGADLNAWSATTMAVSCAQAVEFSGHFAHSFLIMHGTRKERAGKALMQMFNPMAHGAMSSLLAVCLTVCFFCLYVRVCHVGAQNVVQVVPLAFAQFPFFRTYYFSVSGSLHAAWTLLTLALPAS